MDEEQQALVDHVADNLDEVVANLFLLRGEPVKLTDYQHEFLAAAVRRKYSKYVFRACTRTGKTESTSILAVLLAVTYPNEEIMVMAHEFRQAEKLFRNIRDYIMNSPKLVGFVDFNKPFRMNEMNFVNGTVMRCMSPANVDAALGFGATVLILDEATSIPDVVYRTRLIRMMAGTAGRNAPVLILLGTSHTLNFMYQVDTDDSPDIYHQVVDWKLGVKAGILDEKVVMDAQKSMSDDEFAMWFGAEWRQAGEVLFDMKKVRNVMVNTQWSNRLDGYEYFMALDVARLGSDETAVTIFAIPIGVPWEEAIIQQVFSQCRKKRPINDTIGWLKGVVEFWKPIKIGIDSGGLGGGVFDLMREAFPSLLSELKTVGQERVDIYMALSDLVDHAKVLLLNDEKLYKQLGTFGVSYTAAGKRTITKQEHTTDDLADATCFCAYLIRSYRQGGVFFLDSVAKSSLYTENRKYNFGRAAQGQALKGI